MFIKSLVNIKRNHNITLLNNILMQSGTSYSNVNQYHNGFESGSHEPLEIKYETETF